MMSMPQKCLTAKVTLQIPQQFRKEHPSFGRPYLGKSFHSYIEGASFDCAGNLYVVDIPYSRILRIDPNGVWTSIVQYDGRPKGLAIHRDGRLIISDNNLGVLEYRMGDDAPQVFMDRWPYGHVQACNDITITPSGQFVVTDQGASSLIDPSGRVLRWTEGGKVENLISIVPGPNGVLCDLGETQLFVSATRANAIWNLQLGAEKNIERAGVFANMPGGMGPDGLALDVENGIVVAQCGVGVFRFDYRGRLTHFVEPAIGDLITSVAFRPGTRTVCITEASTGTIQEVDMPFEGAPTFGLN